MNPNRSKVPNDRIHSSRKSMESKVQIFGIFRNPTYLAIVCLWTFACITTETENPWGAAAIEVEEDTDLYSNDDFANDDEYLTDDYYDDQNDIADTTPSIVNNDDDEDVSHQNDEEHEREYQSQKHEEFVCGVYLAESTLPGTGIGMYAGPKGYKEGELITKQLGDLVIPITDLKTTQSDTGLYDENSEDMTKYFLWDQYTWSARAFGINIEHISTHQNELASAGFGAAANSFMDFVNVHEGGVQFGLLETEDGSDATIHRSKDPGAGAFSPYHSRTATAASDIAPNSEFFVSYGDDWFVDRSWRLGTIPVSGDHEEAEMLWKNYDKNFLGGRRRKQNRLKQRQEPKKRRTGDTPESPSTELEELYREYWHTVVAPLRDDVWKDSRVFKALPSEAYSEDYSEMLTTEGGYVKVKQQKMSRSQDWLEEHGVCADAVRIGRSSLPNRQAGHGAFARKTFTPGEVVMAAPLIHIPDRAILDTYYIYPHEKSDEDNEDAGGKPYESETEFENRIERELQRFRLKVGYEKTGKQLLLNYVFGHPESTMLLSPYGPGVQLINHNQTLANVRLQWASTTRSAHNPHLLEKSVDYICKHHPLGSALAMEIVATQEIKVDDEIFLDYGDAWEDAWNAHVRTWEPLPGSEGYISASDLNTRPEYRTKPIPRFDPKRGKRPFPPTVRLMLNTAWKDDELRKESGDAAITEEIMYEDYEYEPVQAIFPTANRPTKKPNKKVVDKGQEILSLNYDDDPLVPKLTEDQKARVREAYREASYEANDVQASVEDETLYTVVVMKLVENEDEDSDDEKEGEYVRQTIYDVPRRGLMFEDLSYSHDQFLQNAFRHEIHIPDDIFPEAWKNIGTIHKKTEASNENGDQRQHDDYYDDDDDDDDALPTSQ